MKNQSKKLHSETWRFEKPSDVPDILTQVNIYVDSLMTRLHHQSHSFILRHKAVIPNIDQYLVKNKLVMNIELR